MVGSSGSATPMITNQHPTLPHRSWILKSNEYFECFLSLANLVNKQQKHNIKIYPTTFYAEISFSFYFLSNLLHVFSILTSFQKYHDKIICKLIQLLREWLGRKKKKKKEKKEEKKENGFGDVMLS